MRATDPRPNQLHFARRGRNGWITIDNPPYNNLVHPVFGDREELIEFLNDPELKWVIIKGSGRHFCAGAAVGKLSELAQQPQALQQALDLGKELLTIISQAPIPVAALILGSCLGGGLEIALHCHFRFAGHNAMLGFPESDHGLMPGMGGTLLGRELLATGQLIDLILSGRLIRAEEAQEIGLVETIGPAKSIEEKLVGFLDRLTARHSAKLIRAVMTSIHNGRKLPIKEALREETRLFCQLAKDGIVLATTKERP